MDFHILKYRFSRNMVRAEVYQFYACMPTGYAEKEDLYLIWLVNIKWQFTMPDEKTYPREVTLDNKGQGVYDPIPLSLETPTSINWILVVVIELLSVGVIGFITYFVIRKRYASAISSDISPIKP